MSNKKINLLLFFLFFKKFKFLSFLSVFRIFFYFKKVKFYKILFLFFYVKSLKNNKYRRLVNARKKNIQILFNEQTVKFPTKFKLKLFKFKKIQLTQNLNSPKYHALSIFNTTYFYNFRSSNFFFNFKNFFSFSFNSFFFFYKRLILISSSLLKNITFLFFFNSFNNLFFNFFLYKDLIILNFSLYWHPIINLSVYNNKKNDISENNLFKRNILYFLKFIFNYYSKFSKKIFYKFLTFFFKYILCYYLSYYNFLIIPSNSNFFFIDILYLRFYKNLLYFGTQFNDWISFKSVVISLSNCMIWINFLSSLILFVYKPVRNNSFFSVRSNFKEYCYSSSGFLLPKNSFNNFLSKRIRDSFVYSSRNKRKNAALNRSAIASNLLIKLLLYHWNPKRYRFKKNSKIDIISFNRSPGIPSYFYLIENKLDYNLFLKRVKKQIFFFWYLIPLKIQSIHSFKFPVFFFKKNFFFFLILSDSYNKFYNYKGIFFFNFFLKNFEFFFFKCFFLKFYSIFYKGFPRLKNFNSIDNLNHDFLFLNSRFFRAYNYLTTKMGQLDFIFLNSYFLNRPFSTSLNQKFRKKRKKIKRFKIY